MPKSLDLRVFDDNIFQVDFHTLSGDKTWEGPFANVAALALAYVKVYAQNPQPWHARMASALGLNETVSVKELDISKGSFENLSFSPSAKDIQTAIMAFANNEPAQLWLMIEAKMIDPDVEGLSVQNILTMIMAQKE